MRDSRMRTRVYAAVMALGCHAAAAVPCEAQAPGHPAWTIELHGGAMLGGQSGGGTAGTFPVGATFATETDTGRPSRVNPSWYFGDGAALFNQVQGQFASVLGHNYPRIAPLDGMLTSAALERRAGPAFGVRITRRLTDRFGIEAAFARASARGGFTGAASGALEAARDSFEQGFRGLLDLQQNLQVTSTLDTSAGSSQQNVITAALAIALSDGPRLRTHAVVGAGRLATSGGMPEARLRGSYQYRFLGTYPIAETDAVTIRFTDDGGSTVGLVGGGATFGLGPNRGLRMDVRAHLRPGRMVTTVEASPTIAQGTPSIALPSNTTPAIQFSTFTGIPSSLGGSASRLTTFTSSGLETRIQATIGYVIRF
jgi:hypothetical protein